MPTKNNKERVFGRTEIHKHKLEKSRDKKKEYSSYIPIFLGISLAVMLLFAGVGVASAKPTAVIHVGSQQQVGYTVCIDGSQSYSQGDKNDRFVNDIFEITHYSWDFGDGTGVKSGEYLNTITHVYNAPGTYTITLTVTDYAGRSTSTSKSVTVKTLPKVTVSSKSRSAIVSAINSLGGKPGIVYIPAGTYYISSKISIPSGVILEGAGMTKTQLINTGSSFILFVTGNNVRITGIEFKGNGNNHGIWCSGKKNLYVDHCEMHGFSYANNIAYYGSATYEYNYIHDNTKGGAGYGITVTGGSYTMIRYNEFASNRHSVDGGGSAGKLMNTGYDFIHNHVEGVHGDSALAMHCGGAGRTRICDNVFENIGYHSAVSRKNSWGEIRRNTFKNVGLAVVYLQEPTHNGVWIPGGGAYNYQIDHNTFINCPTHYWIKYGTDIYINCRKIDNLIPYKGDAPWDDCVDVYGTISGTVTDKDTGVAIEGATVTAGGYSEGTDNNGNYIIPIDLVGTYTVTASKAGYFPESQKNIQVVKDERKTVNFQLTEAPELAGEWHFNEGNGTTTADSSGNGDHGTIHGATWTVGKKGSGLKFDGTDDYVNCGNDPSLNIADEITIIAWIYPTGKGDSNYSRIVDKSNSIWGSALGYKISLRAAEDYKLTLCAGGVGKDTDSKVTLNEWNYLAFIITGTKWKLFLNGNWEEWDEATLPSSVGNPLFIGNSPVDNRPINGTIDEVKIYNRALSAEEIKADYEAGVNSTYPSYDVNEDGKVDILDTTIVGQHFGETTNSSYPSYDVNEDGKVDILDTTIVGQHFGEITS